MIIYLLSLSSFNYAISNTRSSQTVETQSSLQANLLCYSFSVMIATQPLDDALVHSKLTQVSLLFTAVCDEGISYITEYLTRNQKNNVLSFHILNGFAKPNLSFPLIPWCKEDVKSFKPEVSGILFCGVSPDHKVPLKKATQMRKCIPINSDYNITTKVSYW